MYYYIGFNCFTMANSYTDLFQKDAILKMFDQQNTVYYEVMQGKIKKFDSIDHCEDADDARNYLDMQLTAIEHFGSPQQFTINFYRELTDKNKFSIDNLKASNTFKLNENGMAAPGSYWGNRRGVGAVDNNSVELQEIREILQQQQSMINALLEEPDEKESKDQGSLSGVMGLLAGIINNPDVQAAIAAKAIGFLNTIVPDPSGQTMNMNAHPQLNGITQNDITQLNIAVTKLIDAGMLLSDFEKLAIVTQKPEVFKMYLTMLRSS